MPRTSTETRRREAMRRQLLERQAQADAAETRRKEAEVEIGTDFEVARDDRATALAAVRAAEDRMAQAVQGLFTLGIPTDRVATLTGEPEPDVKRLRKLAAEHQSDTPAASVRSSSATAAASTASGPVSTAESGSNRNTDTAAKGRSVPGSTATGPATSTATSGSSAGSPPHRIEEAATESRSGAPVAAVAEKH